jgi:hypothetical protein
MATTQSLRNRVAIVGVGESDIGKIPGMSGLGLNAQAARRALEDSGLKVADIDGVLTAYSFTEPYFMLGTVLCEYLGVQPRYNASMVVGGATPAVMLKHAAEAIAAGSADTVLVCAGENRATGQSRDQAVAALMAVGHPYFERPYGPSIPGMYAMISRRHMEEFGTTERQMASVAVTARHHASMHPKAHMRQPISVDESIQHVTALPFKGGEDINRRLRQQTMGSVGPAGFLLADDTEMYERNHRGSKIRDPEWLVLTRGLHRERLDENGYRIAHSTDETTQRGIWRHYLKLMTE